MRVVTLGGLGIAPAVPLKAEPAGFVSEMDFSASEADYAVSEAERIASAPLPSRTRTPTTTTPWTPPPAGSDQAFQDTVRGMTTGIRIVLYGGMIAMAATIAVAAKKAF